MKCAWQAYLKLLPLWMQNKVDDLGRDILQELRLRVGRPVELVTLRGCVFLERVVVEDDLMFCINVASNYSPWVSSTTKSGYITAHGGHRVGICGNAVVKNGKVQTITEFTSLCIRVARDFPGIAMQTSCYKGSTLILGSPGRGKTTLLRDVVRGKSNHEGQAVAVVDERGEIFPVVDGEFCFPPGIRTDILTGCSKSEGIEILIRTMNPRWIAVDEITAEEDTNAILRAAVCGVEILATAHAENIEDLLCRPVYRPLIEQHLFKNIIVMNSDKSWTLERINI